MRTVVGEHVLEFIHNIFPFPNPLDRGVPGRLGHLIQPNNPRIGRLIAGCAVHLVIEHDVRQIFGVQGSDRRQCAHPHEDVPVPVEHHNPLIGLRQSQPQSDGRRHAHRPDHVKRARPVPDLLGLPRREPITHNHRFIGKEVKQRLHRLGSTLHHPFFRSHRLLTLSPPHPSPLPLKGEREFPSFARTGTFSEEGKVGR